MTLPFYDLYDPREKANEWLVASLEVPGRRASLWGFRHPESVIIYVRTYRIHVDHGHFRT